MILLIKFLLSLTDAYIYKVQDSLFLAIQNNDTERIKKIIQHYPLLLNKRNIYGLTPVHTAIFFRKNKAAIELINLGCNVNLYVTRDSWINMLRTMHEMKSTKNNVTDSRYYSLGVLSCLGESPLHLSICKNNTTISKLIIQNGGTFSTSEYSCCSPLYYASVKNNKKLIIFFLSSYRNDNHLSKSNKAKFKFHKMVKDDFLRKVINKDLLDIDDFSEFLISKKKVIDNQYFFYNLLIEFGITNNNLPLVKYLLKPENSAELNLHLKEKIENLIVNVNDEGMKKYLKMILDDYKKDK